MSRSDNILVTKSTGEKVPFDIERLRRSLARSGADKTTIDAICGQIEQLLYDGISTREIYKKAFSLLRKSSDHTAARYKLKKAIYELGPTGFPFEKFIAAILRYEGYEARTNIIVQGSCVEHEVDVIAEKEERQFIVECKFHRNYNNHCDVKVPMYIHSRFEDIKKKQTMRSGNNLKIQQGWIFTNTRFTADAIQYGNCVGIKLVGWKYPHKGSLNERIDNSGLHPITCLTTLTKQEKQRLLNGGVVLCMELCNDHRLFDQFDIPVQKRKRTLKEANQLCKNL